MNIEQANAIPITKILEKRELAPVRESASDAMYFSPFRNERTPSFHVNKEANLWYDHGEGRGGNSFNLVIEILKAEGMAYSPADALRWFRNTNLDPALPILRDPVKHKGSKWRLIRDEELENLALIRYLRERGISVSLAKRYVNEIYVGKKGTLKMMYAIGFRNIDGGYELRNQFIKSCIAPKTISFVRADTPKPRSIMIFEGFMDFLTYLTIKEGKLPHDTIVLNSVACVDHAFRYIKNYGYVIAYSCFDNDKAGEKAKERLSAFMQTEPGLLHKPLNRVYEGHKDLNDWHMHNLQLKGNKPQ